MPNGDVLVLPAVWPVRLTPEQRKQLGVLLLAGDVPEDRTPAAGGT
ncbi:MULTISPECIES: hypothetical protein [Nonomuraea]|uniref:Uncharacterized protein n=1 Tax=Nonomuraea mangrovi TaxID=2316207 RepID=A0ABW4T8W0_9ACTN